MDKKNKFIVNKDISKAKTLDSDYYLNEKIFKSSIQKIFLSSWHFVAHKTDFKQNNVILFF